MGKLGQGLVNLVYEYIKKKPRTIEQIIKYCEKKEICKERAVYRTLNGLKRSGKIVQDSANGGLTVYSVCYDDRLEMVANIVAYYDKGGRRISKISENWQKWKVFDLTDDGEQVMAVVWCPGSSAKEGYGVTLNIRGDHKCACAGNDYYHVPCYHILILAIETNHVDWLEVNNNNDV